MRCLTISESKKSIESLIMDTFDSPNKVKAGQSIRSSYLFLCALALILLSLFSISGFLQAKKTIFESQRRHLSEQLGVLETFLYLEGWIDTKDSQEYKNQEFRILQKDPSVQLNLMDLGSVGATRYTVLDESGVVLADSNANPDYMDNHRSRPEIAEAMKGHPAESVRYSNTLKTNMLYLARNANGLVLRVAAPLSEIQTLEQGFLWTFLIFFILSALVLLSLVFFYYRRLSIPLGRLVHMAQIWQVEEMPQIPLIDNPRELSHISKAMKRMAQDLQSKIITARNQEAETQAILHAINDAVILLDRNQVMLRCNHSAIRLFARINPDLFTPADLELLFSSAPAYEDFFSCLEDKILGNHLLAFIRSSELARFIGAVQEEQVSRESWMKLSGFSQRVRVNASPLDLKQSIPLVLLVISPESSSSEPD